MASDKGGDRPLPKAVGRAAVDTCAETIVFGRLAVRFKKGERHPDDFDQRQNAQYRPKLIEKRPA